MPPEDSAPGSALDWLRHAKSDLALARLQPSPDVLLAQLCLHAQQAAEKALKAILVSRGIPPKNP
jgi:HEPN domain-containing protein